MYAYGAKGAAAADAGLPGGPGGPPGNGDWAGGDWPPGWLFPAVVADDGTGAWPPGWSGNKAIAAAVNERSLAANQGAYVTETWSAIHAKLVTLAPFYLDLTVNAGSWDGHFDYTDTRPNWVWGGEGVYDILVAGGVEGIDAAFTPGSEYAQAKAILELLVWVDVWKAGLGSLLSDDRYETEDNVTEAGAWSEVSLGWVSPTQDWDDTVDGIAGNFSKMFNDGGTWFYAENRSYRNRLNIVGAWEGAAYSAVAYMQMVDPAAHIPLVTWTWEDGDETYTQGKVHEFATLDEGVGANRTSGYVGDPGATLKDQPPAAGVDEVNARGWLGERVLGNFTRFLVMKWDGDNGFWFFND